MPQPPRPPTPSADATHALQARLQELRTRWQHRHAAAHDIKARSDAAHSALAGCLQPLYLLLMGPGEAAQCLAARDAATLHAALHATQVPSPAAPVAAAAGARPGMGLAPAEEDDALQMLLLLGEAPPAAAGSGTAAGAQQRGAPPPPPPPLPLLLESLPPPLSGTWRHSGVHHMLSAPSALIFGLFDAGGVEDGTCGLTGSAHGEGGPCDLTGSGRGEDGRLLAMQQQQQQQQVQAEAVQEGMTAAQPHPPPLPLQQEQLEQLPPAFRAWAPRCRAVRALHALLRHCAALLPSSTPAHARGLDASAATSAPLPPHRRRRLASDTSAAGASGSQPPLPPPYLPSPEPDAAGPVRPSPSFRTIASRGSGEGIRRDGVAGAQEEQVEQEQQAGAHAQQQQQEQQQLLLDQAALEAPPGPELEVSAAAAAAAAAARRIAAGKEAPEHGACGTCVAGKQEPVSTAAAAAAAAAATEVPAEGALGPAAYEDTGTEAGVPQTSSSSSGSGTAVTTAANNTSSARLLLLASLAECVAQYCLRPVLAAQLRPVAAQLQSTQCQLATLQPGAAPARHTDTAQQQQQQLPAEAGPLPELVPFSDFLPPHGAAAAELEDAGSDLEDGSRHEEGAEGDYEGGSRLEEGAEGDLENGSRLEEGADGTLEGGNLREGGIVEGGLQGVSALGDSPEGQRHAVQEEYGEGEGGMRGGGLHDAGGRADGGAVAAAAAAAVQQPAQQAGPELSGPQSEGDDACMQRLLAQLDAAAAEVEEAAAGTAAPAADGAGGGGEAAGGVLASVHSGAAAQAALGAVGALLEGFLVEEGGAMAAEAARARLRQDVLPALQQHAAKHQQLRLHHTAAFGWMHEHLLRQVGHAAQPSRLSLHTTPLVRPAACLVGTQHAQPQPCRRTVHPCRRTATALQAHSHSPAGALFTLAGTLFTLAGTLFTPAGALFTPAGAQPQPCRRTVQPCRHTVHPSGCRSEGAKHWYDRTHLLGVAYAALGAANTLHLGEANAPHLWLKQGRQAVFNVLAPSRPNARACTHV